jgi:iron(III) transport system ATP-binding protein
MSFITIRKLSKQYLDNESLAVDNFNIEIEQGEIVTLLGPSGCGKTTTLRMIAGFEMPTHGSIEIDNQLIFDQHAVIPPEKRGIGMVFQDYALFPHLTIGNNVSFGLSKWKAKDKKSRVEEVLLLVGLADYQDKYPHQLSGGQQQRVALARALAPRPNVVLMDEPFSNLDAGLKEKMRHDVAEILRKAQMTAIIVTHDQKDAFAISDRVVVMNEGVIQQIATPRDMYRCPKNCFVAQFLGKTNILKGTLDHDLKHVFTDIGKVCLPEQQKQKLEDVTLSIRPEACYLKAEGRYCGKVDKVTYSGSYQELHVQVHTGNQQESMVLYAPNAQEIQEGQVVFFDISPDYVAVVEN